MNFSPRMGNIPVSTFKSLWVSNSLCQFQLSQSSGTQHRHLDIKYKLNFATALAVRGNRKCVVDFCKISPKNVFGCMLIVTLLLSQIESESETFYCILP